MAWYLAILRRTQPPQQQAIGAHLNWMRTQHERGTVLISGPSSDRSMSLYVLRAPSQTAAAKIAAEDPLAQGEQTTFEIIEWDVHQVLGIGAFGAN